SSYFASCRPANPPPQTRKSSSPCSPVSDLKGAPDVSRQPLEQPGGSHGPLERTPSEERDLRLASGPSDHVMSDIAVPTARHAAAPPRFWTEGVVARVALGLIALHVV